MAAISLVEIRPVSFHAPESAYDWLLFTSAQGVRHYLEQRACGLTVDFTPTRFDAESFARELAAREPLKGRSILWPSGQLAGEQFPQLLREAGAEVTPLVVYHTVARERLDDEERTRFAQATVLAFTSPSAIEAFASLGLPLKASCRVAALGASTRSAALSVLGRADIVPAENTLAALGAAVRNALTDQV